MIAPAAHAKTEVEEWPVEWLGSENVFLVRVGDESIVGCPHGNVEVDKVPPEGRFVQFGVTRGHYNGISRYATTLVIFFFLKKRKKTLTSLVPVRLDIPVRVQILWVVLLCT